MRTIVKAYVENKRIIRKKLEAELCLSEGFTRRKAQEYINLLVDAERVDEIDGLLILNEREVKERELDKIKEIDNAFEVDNGEQNNEKLN